MDGLYLPKAATPVARWTLCLVFCKITDIDFEWRDGRVEVDLEVLKALTTQEIAESQQECQDGHFNFCLATREENGND